MKSIWLPRTPPAALISLTASFAPLAAGRSSADSSPVSAKPPPILIVPPAPPPRGRRGGGRGGAAGRWRCRRGSARSAGRAAARRDQREHRPERESTHYLGAHHASSNPDSGVTVTSEPRQGSAATGVANSPLAPPRAAMAPHRPAPHRPAPGGQGQWERPACRMATAWSARGSVASTADHECAAGMSIPRCAMPSAFSSARKLAYCAA